ncbi:MAG: hypothetical protein R3C28_10795 [Pirellulaceae bacterium]
MRRTLVLPLQYLPDTFRKPAEFHVADEDDDGQDRLVVVVDGEIQVWEWSDTTQQFALDRTIVTGQSTIDSLQLHFDVDGDLDLVFVQGNRVL